MAAAQGTRTGAGKACASCRLSHVSCDRNQPCWRCVRLGRADTCQPPLSRKRGRPRTVVVLEGPTTTTTTTGGDFVEEKARSAAVPYTDDDDAGVHRISCSSPTTNEQPLPATKRARLTSADANTTTPPSQALAVQGLTGPPALTAPQDPMLRSMLTVMAERVREVHEENERLQESIADMRDWQKKTTHKLSALEVESRTKIRSLAQAHAEMTQRWRRSINQLELYSETTHAHPSLHHALMCTLDSSGVEEIIERSLPFLRRFHSPSLIIKDHRTPWVVMRMSQPETLDELETPIIVYVSPAMCELVGYEACELQGLPITTIGTPNRDTLVPLARIVLARSSTPVGEPIVLNGFLATKQRHGIRAISQHQVLYNERRLADYCIMQVLQVLERDLSSAPHMKSMTSLVHNPHIRERLIAWLPQSLLFGRQGDVGAAHDPEATTTAPLLATRTTTATLHHHDDFQLTSGAGDGDDDDDYQLTLKEMRVLTQSATISLPSPLIDQCQQQQMMLHRLASPGDPHFPPHQDSLMSPPEVSEVPPAARLAERWLSM